MDCETKKKRNLEEGYTEIFHFAAIGKRFISSDESSEKKQTSFSFKSYIISKKLVPK